MVHQSRQLSSAADGLRQYIIYGAIRPRDRLHRHMAKATRWLSRRGYQAKETLHLCERSLCVTNTALSLSLTPSLFLSFSLPFYSFYLLLFLSLLFFSSFFSSSLFFLFFSFPSLIYDLSY